MDTPFKLALVVIFGGAVIIGIIAGRSEAAPTAAAAPTPTATALPVPLPNHVNIIPGNSNDQPAFDDPSVLTVHPGDMVTWTNLTSGSQTATADSGVFNSDVLAPGQSYTWTATKTGRFPYGSYLSPNVRGEIDVVP